MTTPFDRASEAVPDTSLAPYGPARVQQTGGNCRFPLPPDVIRRVGVTAWDRWYDPRTNAIVLVPEGEDPPDLEPPE